MTDRRDKRRFFRDSERGYLGGVSAGLGEYFNIDPLWIRLAFMAFMFLKGLGSSYLCHSLDRCAQSTHHG